MVVMPVDPLPDQKPDNHACRQRNPRRQACPHAGGIVHRCSRLMGAARALPTAARLCRRGMPQRRARVSQFRWRRQGLTRRQSNWKLVVVCIITFRLVFGHCCPYPCGTHSPLLCGARTQKNAQFVPAFSITHHPGPSQLPCSNFALFFTNFARQVRIAAGLFPYFSDLAAANQRRNKFFRRRYKLKTRCQRGRKAAQTATKLRRSGKAW